MAVKSQLALQTVPPSMYSWGTSSRVKVMTYAGEGKIILTTEIKLKLHGRILKLSLLEVDLNNGSWFSFSVEVIHRKIGLVPHQSDLHPAPSLPTPSSGRTPSPPPPSTLLRQVLSHSRSPYWPSTCWSYINFCRKLPSNEELEKNYLVPMS